MFSIFYLIEVKGLVILLCFFHCFNLFIMQYIYLIYICIFFQVFILVILIVFYLNMVLVV